MSEPQVVARLVWVRGENRVEFPLSENHLVGRDDEADIRIDEPLVSRLHARIERRGDGFVVIDLGSTNLTRVNGQIVREQALQAGDEVQFGRARCRFETTAPEPSTDPPTEPMGVEYDPGTDPLGKPPED